MTLGRAFIKAAKRRPTAFCMADSTGQELTFARALTAALLLAGVIRRTTTGQRYVGLLLPASVGGALANVATSLAGKVSVNLNFTAGHDAMAAAIERCGISTILTARGFVAKAGIEPMDGMVFVEDCPERASRRDQARAISRWPPRCCRRRSSRGLTHRSGPGRSWRPSSSRAAARRAQGRDAHAPQHPGEHRRRCAGVSG